MLDQIQVEQCWQQTQQWVAQEGWLRMVEHIIVVIVLIRLIKKGLTIESRGKIGLVSYFMKLILRFSDRLSFVKNKKEEYLEKESTKSAE
jgi:hypothetical protein